MADLRSPAGERESWISDQPTVQGNFEGLYDTFSFFSLIILCSVFGDIISFTETFRPASISSTHFSILDCIAFRLQPCPPPPCLRQKRTSRLLLRCLPSMVCCLTLMEPSLILRMVSIWSMHYLSLENPVLSCISPDSNCQALA